MVWGYFDMGLFWFGVISVWGYFGLGLLWFGVILVGLFQWGYFGLGLFHTVAIITCPTAMCPTTAKMRLKRTTLFGFEANLLASFLHNSMARSSGLSASWYITEMAC